MSRTLRDSLTAFHRRGHNVTGTPNQKDPADDRLDLFSRGRRSLSIVPSEESDVSIRLGRLSVGSAKPENKGSDDFLSSEGGKHDYDWLLTPPGTPLVPFSNGNDSHQSNLAPRSRPLARSTSTTKASRLSTFHPETNQTVKPIRRSSSVTRVSSTSTFHKSTSILSTSSASISSYIKPIIPTTRPSTKQATSSARSSVSRSNTPSKSRPATIPTLCSLDKPRPSRPSTPTSSSRSTNSNGSTSTTPSRISSRPSTPVRRNTTSSPSRNSTSIGRISTSVSCPNSPATRVRPPPQPFILPDFSLETPPNLLTTLPDRPLSAGRSRPKATKKNGEDSPPITMTISKRQPSPIAARGRIADPTLRNRSEGMELRRESSTRRPSTESTSFIRNMESRNGSNGHKRVTSTNPFPQSIRSGNQKNLSLAALSITSNGVIGEKGNSLSSARLINPDIYESSRYEMIFHKEDPKNTNWLHMPDQELMFDYGFGPLPEPFSPL